MDHLVVPMGFDVPHDTLSARRKAFGVAQLPVSSTRHAHLECRRGVRIRPQPTGTRSARPGADLRARAVLRGGPRRPLRRPRGGVRPDPAQAAQPRQHHVAVVGPDGQADHRPAVPQRRRGGGSGRVDVRAADVCADRRITGDAGRDRQDRQAAGATSLDDETLGDGDSTRCRTRFTIPSPPAGWAATTPAWWTRSCGCAASTGCGWPTRR